ncbi:hypothetical protein [Saccharopolyspora sp. NPDC050642]|uniref:hypothetical protein n=1 Tax=Saccharopolyspora sp. NPDC050642 TaxID=3157099 RepID=UPI0033F1BAC5
MAATGNEFCPETPELLLLPLLLRLLELLVLPSLLLVSPLVLPPLLFLSLLLSFSAWKCPAVEAGCAAATTLDAPLAAAVPTSATPSAKGATKARPANAPTAVRMEISPDSVTLVPCPYFSAVVAASKTPGHQ